MHDTVTLPPPLTIPPEVEAFALEKGAAVYLPAVAALVQRLVPNYPIIVRLDDDPELSYNRTILFWVDVDNWDSDRLFETQQRWTWEIADVCPTTHTHVFGFIMWPHE